MPTTEATLRATIIQLEQQPHAADELACALNDLADEWVAQGRCDAEVLALYQRALAVLTDNGGLHQPDAANVLNNLAAVQLELADYPAAQASATQALHIMNGLFAQADLVADTDAETLAACQTIRQQAMRQLAHALRAQSRYPEAEALLHLALAEQPLGEPTEATADTLNDMGVLYKYAGNYAQAESCYQQALTILQDLYGKGQPELATIYYNLAGLHHARKQFSAAELLCRKALALQAASLPDQHPQLAVTRGTLAAILDGLGRYPEAEALYRQALANHVARYSTEHPEVALNLHNLAANAQLRGHGAEAEALYLQALHIRERCLGADHPQVATCLYHLALLYPRIGKAPEAAALLQRAVTILAHSLGEEHPQTQQCRAHWLAMG